MDIFETLINQIDDELQCIGNIQETIEERSKADNLNIVSLFVCEERRKFYTDLRGKLADLGDRLETVKVLPENTPFHKVREALAVKSAERELAKGGVVKPTDYIVGTKGSEAVLPHETVDKLNKATGKLARKAKEPEDDGSVTVHPEIKPAKIKLDVEEHNLLPLDHKWGRNEVAAMFPKMGKNARRAINDLYMDREPDANDFAVLKDHLEKYGYKPEFKLEKLTKDTPLHLFPDMELLMAEDLRRWFNGAGLAPGALEHIRYYLKKKGYKL